METLPSIAFFFVDDQKRQMPASTHCQFSIVIPFFNRRKEIVRAINSCLSQMDRACELLVVDDASTDGSAESIGPFLRDPRITLIRNNLNQGPMGSRLVGTKRARGEWVIFLDSDDEILTGGLTSIREAVAVHGANVHRIGFRYIYDDGSKSPLPSIDTPVTLDFKEYMKWCLSCSRTDALWVTRRSTFAGDSVTEGRCSELVYHFDFSSRFRTLLLPLTVGAVHTDAENRETILTSTESGDASTSNSLLVTDLTTLLSRFGGAMMQTEPSLHRRLSRSTVVALIAAGRSGEAHKHWWRYLSRHPCAEALAFYPLLLLGSTVTKRILRFRQARASRIAQLAPSK